MEGKIFSNSANIYQDQAKVLYDYYKTSAEKIVNEEKIYEEKIKDAEYQIKNIKRVKAKAKTERTLGWIFCWTLVGLIIALIKNSKVKEFDSLIEEKEREIVNFKQAHENIFRDYRITKMGLAYVPVAKRVAYNDKSFIVDQSGVTSNEKFTLQVIKQNELINDAVVNLQDLSKRAPIVESSVEPESVNTGDLSRSIQKINFNDYFGKLDRTLRTISYSLGNVEEYNVELPVVFPNTEYATFLQEHAATKVDGLPIFNVFDTSQFDGDIQRFNELNETRKALSNQSEQVDKVLKTLMVDMADAVQSTAAKKVTSAGNLVEYSNRILFNILKAPYNFYSPVLEAEEIERIRNEKFDYESIDYSYKPFNLRESSKVKLDIRSMSWVADDGSRTIVPFGVNQIQYEIIAPIVSNLLKDTRKERIEIYNHIKDQKLSYLNKWHQDTEDFYGRNRAEAADIINLMRSTLSEYSAAYNTLVAYKKTEESMNASQTLESAVTETVDNSAEILAGYQAQAQQVTQTQQEFSEYMERLHEDIDARAEKFGYVEYYDASLRDKQARDTAVAAENVNLLDDRRRPLAEVNPLLAKISELPPEPNIEQLAYDYAGINLNTIAKEALEELETLKAHSLIKSDEIEQEDEALLLVESVRNFIEELKELDLNEEYGVSDLLTRLDSVQILFHEANNEEDNNKALAQLNDVNNVAQSIKTQLTTTKEELSDTITTDAIDVVEKEDLYSLQEFESLVEMLVELDEDNIYDIQAMASKFIELKDLLDNSDEDTKRDIQQQLNELYKEALDIEHKLKTEE